MRPKRDRWQEARKADPFRDEEWEAAQASNEADSQRESALVLLVVGAIAVIVFTGMNWGDIPWVFNTMMAVSAVCLIVSAVAFILWRERKFGRRSLGRHGCNWVGARLFGAGHLTAGTRRSRRPSAD